MDYCLRDSCSGFFLLAGSVGCVDCFVGEGFYGEVSLAEVEFAQVFAAFFLL